MPDTCFKLFTGAPEQTQARIEDCSSTTRVRGSFSCSDLAPETCKVKTKLLLEFAEVLAINKNQLRARSWFSRQQRCVELRQYKHGTKGILTIFVYQHGCEASEPGMRRPARLGRRVRRASCSDALLEES